MTDRSPIHEGGLDAGLRAAFGTPTRRWSWGDASVSDVLSLTTGVRAGVVLRDDLQPGLEPLKPITDDLPGMPSRYELAGELARGGIGVVLKGRDVDLGRDVALKILRDEHSSNPALMRRLIDEAQIAGQLQHPGILPVYELGLDAARRPFFAMKLIRGESLAAMLQRRPSPDHEPDTFLGIFEQVCHTIAYAHARGVIHRDLKPSNVMVGAFGEVQVVDWGLAKVLAGGAPPQETADRLSSDPGAERAPSAPRPALSEAGSVLGTPAYMAPEQALGQIDQIDERSDVFGLGAMLCEILTGHPPYVGTRLDVIEQARRADVEPLRRRLGSSGAAPALVELAMRCMQPEREDRPRDAGELVRRIQAYRAAIRARARAAELEAAEARAQAASERRSRRLTLAFAAAVLLGGGVLGWSLVRSEHEALRAERATYRADQAVVEAERERSRRLESALALLVPLESKGEYVLTQVAQATPRDRAKWVGLLGLLREIVLRNAAGAPDRETRQRSAALARRLLEREQELSRAK
jgi:hypothetical protein